MSMAVDKRDLDPVLKLPVAETNLTRVVQGASKGSVSHVSVHGNLSGLWESISKNL